MNRIHGVAPRPDAIYTPDAAAVETYPPLHICPISERIVSCIEDCPDCAEYDELYRARFHARIADKMFGQQPRLDAGIDRSYTRGFLNWILDSSENWSSGQVWAAIVLSLCGFWSVFCYLVTRHG